MTLGRNDGARSLQGWMAIRFRRLAYEVAARLLDLIERESALDDGQRARLIGELEAELSDQIDDIRETGEAPSDLGAREMLVTRGIIRWLRNGEDPGPSGLRLLEKHRGLHRPWQGDSDRVADVAFAAAITDLREGDVGASAFPQQLGDPVQRQRMLDFQGGRVRELMEGRGLTIGSLADLSGVDVVELVAILSGLTGMELRDRELLSGALAVDLDAAFVGIRFVRLGSI